MRNSSLLIRLAAISLPMALWHNSADAWNISYDGRATVVDATAQLGTVSAKVVVADTGELDPSGAPRDATVATLSNPPPLQIQAQALTAHTEGGYDTSTSYAAITKLAINLPGLAITADVVQANSQAQCLNYLPSVQGSANVVNLTVNGISYPGTGQPNQTINLGLAKIVLNEQMPSATAITVNAIHISVPGLPGLLGTDVVISHAESSIEGCDAYLAPFPVISWFSPATGAPGTVVTVNGTSFTGITQAWVGNAHDAKVTVVNDTTVQVVIPQDATTGPIGIGNSENWAFSDTNFVVTP